jgi:chromosomal replication initiation ATPase DnaA
MSDRQFPLDLPVMAGHGAADFITGRANSDVMAWIERWPDWPAPGLVIVGPPRSGKTHATMLWARRSNAVVVAGAALAGIEPPAVLGERKSVAVEDIDRGVAERILFHLYNLAVQRGGQIVLTAAVRPAEWTLKLADLRSRVMALPTAALTAPDDELLERLLIKLFADRQLLVPAEVIAFLLKRIERSFAAATEVVAALDHAALAAGRAVSVALARRVLEQSPTVREA